MCYFTENVIFQQHKHGQTSIVHHCMIFSRLISPQCLVRQYIHTLMTYVHKSQQRHIQCIVISQCNNDSEINHNFNWPVHNTTLLILMADRHKPEVLWVESIERVTAAIDAASLSHSCVGAESCRWTSTAHKMETVTPN